MNFINRRKDAGKKSSICIGVNKRYEGDDFNENFVVKNWKRNNKKELIKKKKIMFSDF